MNEQIFLSYCVGFIAIGIIFGVVFYFRNKLKFMKYMIIYISAGILIFFGVLFIWGAFSPQGSTGWIPIGLISVGIGFVLIWFASRRKPAAEQTDSSVTLNIDLPGNVDLEAFKCESCGGALTTDNIKMVAGAPVVSCPYCNTTYQLTEDPKW